MKGARVIFYVFSLLIVLCVFTQSSIAGLTVTAMELFAIGPADKAEYTNLYTVDALSGTTTRIGDTGFKNCGAMDFSHDGKLYATCQRADGSDIPVLTWINTATGAGTEVGPTGISEKISDISIIPYCVITAYEEDPDPEHTIYTINMETGQAAVLGDTGLTGGEGNAISHSPDERVLYHIQTSSPLTLYTIDEETGEVNFVTELQLKEAFEAMGRQEAELIAEAAFVMDMDALVLGEDILMGVEAGSTRGLETGTYEFIALAGFVINNADVEALSDTRDIPKGPYIAAIDIDMGLIAVMAEVDRPLTAIAVRPLQQRQISTIPTMSEWGMIIMAVVLFAGALVILARRERRSEV